jgi:hypothetical protein
MTPYQYVCSGVWQWGAGEPVKRVILAAFKSWLNTEMFAVQPGQSSCGGMELKLYPPHQK